MIEKIASLPIVKKHYKGKVRDIFDLGDTLLLVTSDRISAFDVVFPNTIANKGKILNQISVNFFKKTEHIVDNHFISDKVSDYPTELHEFEKELEHRSMLVKKAKVIPFECIVRGYITGSAWKEYKNSGTLAGEKLPEGMRESQKFAEAIFTPSTKAEVGEHDENITFTEMLKRCDPKLANELKQISLDLFNFGHNYLKEKNIILADTKFEFGTVGNKIVLIDEILTPDSSRFWDASDYEVGKTPKSYDKQFVRDYISATGWDKEPPAPELPTDIIEKTYAKYYQAYKAVAEEEAIEWK